MRRDGLRHWRLLRPIVATIGALVASAASYQRDKAEALWDASTTLGVTVHKGPRMVQAPVKHLRGSAAADYQVVPTADLRSIEERVCELERQPACKTFGIESLKGGLTSPLERGRSRC